MGNPEGGEQGRGKCREVVISSETTSHAYLDFIEQRRCANIECRCQLLLVTQTVFGVNRRARAPRFIVFAFLIRLEKDSPGGAVFLHAGRRATSSHHGRLLLQFCEHTNARKQVQYPPRTDVSPMRNTRTIGFPLT